MYICFIRKEKPYLYYLIVAIILFWEIFAFYSNLEGKCGPFDARKYLKSAITKFLFRSDDHQWSEAVFGASFLRPASDHCEKGVQEYATRSTSCWYGVSGKAEVEGMDRGLSTFSPLAPLVRTLGRPNERLCHFYISRLFLPIAHLLRPMLSLNDGCQYWDT